MSDYPTVRPPTPFDSVDWDRLPLATMARGEAFLIPAAQLTHAGLFRTSKAVPRIHNAAIRLGRRISCKKTDAGPWVTRIK